MPATCEGDLQPVAWPGEADPLDPFPFDGGARRRPVLEVAEAWNGMVMSVQHHRRHEGIVGVLDELDDELAGDPLEMFAWLDGDWTCRFRAQWGGYLETPHARVPLDRLVASRTARPAGSGTWRVTLDEDSLIVLDTGQTVFVGRRVDRVPPIAEHPLARFDLAFMGVVVAGLLSLAVFVLALYLAPRTPTLVTAPPVAVVAD